MLIGIHQPNSGNIYIDNKNIKDIKFDHLRENVVYINQRTNLFQDSVLNNIKFGNNVTTKEIEYVIKKCKKAGVVTSICGQAASNPEMVKKLVWFGIDSVSANIDAVENIRKVVMLEEKKRILDYISSNPEKAEGFFHKLLHK